MICPKCGEVNSSNFLFCGMCGTILEPARKVAAAVPSAPPRVPEAALPVVVAAPAPPAMAPAIAPRVVASDPVTPSISGPSLLGLGDDSVDDFRNRAFSGLASYGQPDEPKGAGKEILLTVVLIAALAAAGWWTYKNYIGVAGNRKATSAAPVTDAVNSPPAVDAAADNPAPKQSDKIGAKDAPTASDQPPADTTPAPTKPVETAAAPDMPVAPGKKETKAAAEPDTESAARPVTPPPAPARHEVSATRIPASKPAPAADSGDALFRRGEGFLYGRNGAADCGNAIKYLKMASDQQHAKARSMMGTMYATGHCVPRDLPSSYHWFALALRVDPNNSILEKDLSAVWNQMTPPERQLATKSQ